MILLGEILSKEKKVVEEGWLTGRYPRGDEGGIREGALARLSAKRNFHEITTSRVDRAHRPCLLHRVYQKAARLHMLRDESADGRPYMVRDRTVVQYSNNMQVDSWHLCPGREKDGKAITPSRRRWRSAVLCLLTTHVSNLSLELSLLQLYAFSDVQRLTLKTHFFHFEPRVTSSAPRYDLSPSRILSL